MTIGQANAELLAYPQSRDRFALLKEIAELQILEHYLYVQESTQLQRDRNVDVLFSEGFFLEAEEPEQVEAKVSKKKGNVVANLSKIAYKVLLVLKKVSMALNGSIAKLTLRRQQVLKDVLSGDTMFTHEQLNTLRTRLRKYVTMTELRSKNYDETFSIVMPNQPSANSVKFKTDSIDKQLIREVKDLLAFGLGDLILIKGDGVIVNLDSPFLMSVIHAKASIGKTTIDIKTLRGNLSKEQQRAATNGILLKVKQKNNDVVIAPKLISALESVGLDIVAKEYETRAKEALSEEDAAYYKDATNLWTDISTVVAKTNAVMNNVVQFRTNAIKILEAVTGKNEKEADSTTVDSKQQ